MPNENQECNCPPGEVIPEELQEKIGKLPPEEQREIIQSYRKMSIALSMGNIFGSSNPIAEKLTDEHIHKLIDNDDKGDKRAFINSLINKGIGIIIFIILLAFIIFLAFYYSDDKSQFMTILSPLIALIGGVAAGGFGGYSYGYTKAKKDYE